MKHTLLLFILLSGVTLPIISSENIPISNIPQTSPSCTIFTIAIDDTVFFGNNEDWYEQEFFGISRHKISPLLEERDQSMVQS